MTVRILKGDCRELLATLPDESVHCVVTSPPYWGLRNYNVDGQLGLEPSFHDYIETMTAVFREVRRVLRKDGTLWLNMGDTYATGSSGDRNLGDPNSAKAGGAALWKAKARPPVQGLKPKDLCGIPWRLAFALQADGWYLRSDIIWAKCNPMPESVTDRPTKAHEYLFLLSKSERYYYDAEAIKEEADISSQRDKPVNATESIGNTGGNKRTDFEKNRHTVTHRNRRTVWEIATSPFPEAHFATFPPALVEPCILAGCPAKCCAKCGAPWVREVEKTRTFESGSGRSGNMPNGKNGANLQGGGATLDIRRGPCVQTETLGFLPSCSCFVGPDIHPDLIVPGTCLDPFGGAGTTGLVADRLGRNAILIELNPQYAEMAERRMKDDAGMFAMVAAE